MGAGVYSTVTAKDSPFRRYIRHWFVVLSTDYFRPHRLLLVRSGGLKAEATQHYC